jgi:protoporphyrin/coproporphyrin ferrochelatase
MKKRTAVILFNLGGPDSPQAVKPFLFNLFYDPAILALPNPFRWMLAKIISTARAKKAQKIYAQIGGKSPILEETQAQADALQDVLGDSYKVFVAMRYWHPMAEQVAQQVRAYEPDEVILLPLYPQFSHTTTGTFRKVWEKQGIGCPTRTIGCYPVLPGFLEFITKKITGELKKYPQPMRVLFTAHGLPQKNIDRGDPYQKQVEQTFNALVEKLPQKSGLEYRLSYQSRVGPLQWITPYTDAEIRQAGQDKVGVMVVPIAFVSEHSETLVELDLEYRELALQSGVPHYVRIPTVQADPGFIQGLADLVKSPQTCGSGPCWCGAFAAKG